MSDYIPDLTERYPEGFREMDAPIFTVFPLEDGKPSEHYLPQDFNSFKKAKEYGRSLPCDYTIEEA